ncbi:MAG: hypothetical protein HZB43_02230 [candidate division Zixibacteria bacterium]|nr:hypothetical protein [candidate division Zixibacteria bacterium]
MLKRTLVIGTALAVLIAMGPLSAFAQGTAKTADKASAAPKASATAKTHAMGSPVANEIAVCGCGKIFVPDASTQYLEYSGKRYACCTEGCHKMAAANPEAAAKMSDENLAKAMATLNPPAAKPSN